MDCSLLLDYKGDFFGIWNDPPLDCNGDIYRFCLNAEKLCLKKGVNIVKGASVKKFQTNKKGLIKYVKCDDGRCYHGDKFILANGIESTNLGKQIRVNIPIYPMRGNIVTLYSKEPFPDGPLRNIYSPRNAVLLSPLRPNLIRVSADVQAIGYNHSTDVEGCEAVMERSFKVVNRKLFDESKTEFHSCLRPLSGDDVPIIGQTHVPNLYTITGHGSKGWTLSFGSAVLLADIVDGVKTEIDSSPYSPNRFHLLRNAFQKFAS